MLGVGGFGHLTRYNPDGSIDPSFGTAGTINLWSGPNGTGPSDFDDVVVVNDQIFVVAFATRANAQAGISVERVTSAGQVDQAFGDGGIAYGLPTSDNTVSLLTVGADANIYIGARANISGLGPSFALLERFTTTGAVSSAPTGGSAYSTLDSIAFQSDGKVVCLSRSDAVGYYTLRRLNSDLSGDPTFAEPQVWGLELIDSQWGPEPGGVAGDSPGAVFVRPDGEIIVSGTFGLIQSDGSYLRRHDETQAYISNEPASNARIAGSVFNDLNGDGVRQAGETGTAGWTVYADLNNNGRLDAGEPSAVTDASGNYTIYDVPLAADVVVRQVLPPLYVQTVPSNNAGWHVSLAPGQTEFAPAFGAVYGISTPFLSHPLNVQTDTIEAENFDNGGEGVAYHDSDARNSLGAYRSTGVDIGAVAGASNGFAVGYTYPGEWLAYTIESPTTAPYVLQARVANYKPGGTFHVMVDGIGVTGTMTVPDTGPWDTWQTITSQPFWVTAGTHVMKVVMDRGGYWGNIGDFDSFQFVPSSAPGPSPFLGHPFNINTDTIEAENFDNGGEDHGYHDTTPQNIPGQYRATGVDVFAESNASNGYGVGYTAPGEWLSYTINAPAQGTYTLQSRVANFKQGGTFHVTIDGVDVTGPITVPHTGAWDTWQTLTSRPFAVAAGNHQMKVYMDRAGYWGNIADFDSFRFVQQPVPFLGHPFTAGTDTVEAENFDNGGEGVAYHDSTPQNLGGTSYRDTAVDINNGGSNGYDVGHTAPGEWLVYSITNPTAATFALEASVASFKPGGKFHVEIDGQNVTGPMTVPDTGGWFTFQTITSRPFTLSAGNHLMRLVMDSGGYWGTIGNFDYFRLSAISYFSELDFSDHANFTWAGIDSVPGESAAVRLPGVPIGLTSLGGVPFNIRSNAAGKQAWHADVAANGGNQEVSISISTNVYGVSDVYTLINSWDGVAGPNAYASLTFFGSAGARYTKQLVGNVDIRDYNADDWTNSINGTTTLNVFNVPLTNWNKPGRLDMQHIVLPTEFLDQTLTSISLVDDGGANLQRVVLDGLTVARRA